MEDDSQLCTAVYTGQVRAHIKWNSFDTAVPAHTLAYNVTQNALAHGLGQLL